MLIISDVHAAFGALAEVARSGETLLILGDLLNFIDYRTGEGMACEVYGEEFVRQIIGHRARGDWKASRSLWAEASEGREHELRERLRQAALRQYEQTREALAGANAYVTFGNVDWPDALRECLPAGCRFVDGEVVEIEGYRVGFVGGGSPTPINALGEVSHEDMRTKLESLGHVDILCSHLPPAVEPLYRDVVTGQLERSSPPILEYIKRERPRWHYFGDVHQPQAQRWRIGETISINVGYFRATERAVEHT